jgi:O-antigen ligase
VPERWIRWAARACLALTAWSIPLSTSGMQIGIGGLAALSLLAWWRGMPIVRRTPLDAVLLVCFLAFAVSTLASGRPLRAVGWDRTWVVVGYFGIYWWLEDAADAVRFARRFVLGAVLVSVYGIAQHYTGADWYRELLGRRRYVRPRVAGAEGFAAVGFFRNYLTYAHMLVLPLGFALAAPGRWLRLAGVPLIALAIVFSTARGAWLAAGVMALALVLAARRAVASFAVLAGVVLVAAALSPGFRDQVMPGLTRADWNAGRIAIYAANLEIVHDHPVLGLGFGTYQRAARPYYDRHPRADRRSHAHNNFLQVAAEAGLVGLAAFTLVFATALRFGAEAVVRSRDVAARATALGGCLALVGFLAGGLTQYTFGDNEVATAMWATLAVLMRLRDAGT